jgi:hypothetical protein
MVLVKNNQRQGRGTFIYADGTQCFGVFQAGGMNGFGNCSFSNGNRYEGELRNNQMGGRGVYIFRDGQRVEGIWRQGVFAE